MVEESIIPAGLATGLSNTASGIGDIVVWLFGIIIVGAAAWVVWYVMSHKHKVLLRYHTRRGKFIVEDKAKSVRRQDGDYWHLLRSRLEIPAPPPDAIDLMKNGKYWAEGYIREDQKDQVVWLKDKEANSAEMDAFYPLSTKQRALLVARLRDAIAQRGKGWLEVVAQLAVPFAFIMLIALLFVFWGDIAQPAKEMGAMNVDMQKKQLELVEEYKEVSRQNAKILSALTGEDLVTIRGEQKIVGG